MGTAIKIFNAITKYGSKAWTAIKKGAAAVYASAKTAWDGGYWEFTKWLLANSAALDAIYHALEIAGLID